MPGSCWSGDPDQLSSVEAGAVLADITGALAARLGEHAASPRRPAAADLAVRRRDRGSRPSGPEPTIRTPPIEVLRRGAEDVVFVETDLSPARPAGIEPLAAAVADAGAALRTAAADGDVVAALTALDEHRLLCAHRHGPFGVSRWSTEAERWLAEAVPGYGEDGEWYLGRPLLVTVNDYDLNLFNGDTGVVVAAGGGRAGRLRPG